MSNQPVLFDVPVTGKKSNKRKPADLKINRINREVAKDRYWWHKNLPKTEFKVYASKRLIITSYKTFLDIPVGVRWYVSQLIDIRYNVQYELPIINK